MKIFMSYFENLKVGKKLALGFGLILLLSIAVALCGIKNLNDISIRAEKISQLKVITDQFAMAKAERLEYVKTHDEKYITMNEVNLQQVDKKIESLRLLRWDTEHLKMLNEMSEVMKTYRDKRAQTVRETQQRDLVVSSFVLTREESEINSLAQSYAQSRTCCHRDRVRGYRQTH